MTELKVQSIGNIVELMVHANEARNDFPKRLALACDKAGIPRHGRQKDLSVRMNLTPKAISKWFNGESEPQKDKLDKLASVLGTTAAYLSGYASEDGIIENHVHASNNTYRVEVLDLTVSAGPGVVNNEFVEILRSVEYSNEDARNLFNGRPPSNMRIINVKGDSMSGTLEPDDLLYVDVSITAFDGDGIYAFLYDETAHVKRLHKMKDKLIVISDNKVYPQWEPIEREEMNRVTIFGKVIGSMPQTYRRHG